MPDISEGEWITVIEAIHLISRKCGGDSAAKQKISERIRDDALAISSDWMAIGADIGSIPHQRPVQSKTKFGTGFAETTAPPRLRDGQIPRRLPRVGGAFSSHSDNWENDVKRWHWGWGTLVVSQGPIIKQGGDRFPLRSKIGTRFVLGNARFLRHQILDLASDRPTHSRGLIAPTAKPPRKRSSHRALKIHSALIMLNLEQKIHDNTIQNYFGDYNAYGTQAKIEREIANALECAGQECSESTARRRATKIMQQWADVRAILD